MMAVNNRKHLIINILMRQREQPSFTKHRSQIMTEQGCVLFCAATGTKIVE